MRNISRLLLASIMALSLDTLTKAWAVQTLTLYQPVPVLGELLRFTLGYIQHRRYTWSFCQQRFRSANCYRHHRSGHAHLESVGSPSRRIFGNGRLASRPHLRRRGR